jgi:hypothetical protein
MWCFWSGQHWLNNAPVFNTDWTLKESGKQYIDLVYNKWWTQESGSSNTDGVFKFDGYFGDYDISITVNGKTQSVQAKFYKDSSNTITVQLAE